MNDNGPVFTAAADPSVQRLLLAAAMRYLHRLPYTQRRQEAEEIVATAVQRAVQNSQMYDQARDVVAWLVGFVCRVTHEFFRRHARNPTGPPLDAPQLENLDHDLRRGPSHEVGCEVDNRELFSRVLAELLPGERRLIDLKYREDLTFEEIAGVLGSNANALRQRHHHMICRLRELCRTLGEE